MVPGGPPKPTCNETFFYDAFATTVHVHAAACYSDGSESFNIGLFIKSYQGVLPNTTVTFHYLPPGEKLRVVVIAVGKNGMESIPTTVPIYTKPEGPSCSKAKYQSTNNSITIFGGSFSAKGADSYKVWKSKNPEVPLLIRHDQDVTFYNLASSTDYKFSVQSKSLFGIFSIGRCNISTTTRPNNPDCTSAVISSIGTHDFVLNLTTMKTMDATGYVVEYTTTDTKKNATFTSHSLVQQLSNLKPGSLHTVTIYSIGIAGLLSLKGCTKTAYTRPTIPADNVRIYNDTSYVAIEWTHLDGNVEKYTVEKRCSCENSSCTPCTPSVAVSKPTDLINAVNITGLNPGTYCNVSIVAVSGKLPSDPLQVTVKSLETEPGKVRYFAVTEVTKGSIDVKWVEPMCTNGDILHYKLTISQDQGSVHSYLVNAFQNTYPFQNLQTGTFHNITIAAVNTAGDGPISYLQVYTRETAPSMVTNLQATNISSTSVFVSWGKPISPNGIINKYEVLVQLRSDCVQKIQMNCSHCIKKHEDDSAKLKGDPDQISTIRLESEKCAQQKSISFTENNNRNYSIVVHNLTIFTEYNVSVFAFTLIGSGPVSSAVVRTSEDRPSQPTDLRERSASQSEISLEFQTPGFPNGHIIRLDIEYEYKTQNTCLSENLKYETGTKVVQINNPLGEIYGFSLENLYSYWDYTIRVRMATSAGSGNYSKSKTIRTKPDVPGIVRDINTGHLTSRSVPLTWRKPCQPNGIIKHYLIKVIGGSVLEADPLQTPSNDTSYTVTDLLPYRRYSFNISAKVVGVDIAGESVKSQAVNTSTEAAKKPGNVTFNTTPFSVFLRWELPTLQTGPTYYRADALDSRNNRNTSSCLTKGYTNTSCTIHNLHPYWNYSVTISAITDPFGPNSTTVIIRTKESAPGKVRIFKVSQVQNDTAPREVTLSWVPPSETNRNGIIRNYFIQYWVVDSTGKPTGQVETLSYEPDIFSTSIKQILPENAYFFQIFPSTIFNATEKDYVNETIKISAGAPIPIKLPKDVKAISLGPSAKLSNDERQLSVSLYYRSLCDNSNGNPDSWYIIVAEQSSIPEKLSTPFHDSRTKYESFIKEEYKTWSNVHSQDHFQPYIATTDLKPGCNKHRRHKRATEDILKTYDVLIGEEEDCDGISKHYCNGYLKPDNEYRVRFAVCTSKGCLESEFSTPLTTKPNLVPLIAGSVSAVAAVLVSIIVVIVLLKRNRKGPFQKKSREVERGNDNVNFTTELENVAKPRPVKIADLAQHVHKMHADSNLLFSKEYKLVKDTCPTHTTKAAETQVNRIKNRYTNILSYDHSRVKLLPTEDDEGSDYINANYIPGYNSEREYIATQGPLPFTRDEFWRMIWEQNVSIIVMLTQLVERGRRKCDIYWPDTTREPVYYGDLVVEIESESTLPDYVLRVMSVKLGDTRKTVKHFSYLAWPDMGIPETSEAMLKFAKEVRSHQPPPATNRGPFVVHCSAGVGRTGTYIAVDYLMQHVRTSDVIDIYNLVMKMRNNRPNMVQTEDQYIFIHDCIKDFVNRGDDDDSEEGESAEGEVNPIYENM
ncbi:receptor-type tyrosine-protein phosphatase H-like [Ostrea edulis]|uniref:receptor-type tyrosine-protein phosphatase H-like n=1 Tax=Ostrea edulis TaxID=37623 RepID=UPI0024AEE944|nr:receptor-type tyrosine-protein phosphatase H-like [Ostrea edulis]